MRAVSTKDAAASCALTHTFTCAHSRERADARAHAITFTHAHTLTRWPVRTRVCACACACRCPTHPVYGLRHIGSIDFAKVVASLWPGRAPCTLTLAPSTRTLHSACQPERAPYTAAIDRRLSLRVSFHVARLRACVSAGKRARACVRAWMNMISESLYDRDRMDMTCAAISQSSTPRSPSLPPRHTCARTRSQSPTPPSARAPRSRNQPPSISLPPRAAISQSPTPPSRPRRAARARARARKRAGDGACSGTRHRLSVRARLRACEYATGAGGSGAVCVCVCVYVCVCARAFLRACLCGRSGYLEPDGVEDGEEEDLTRGGGEGGAKKGEGGRRGRGRGGG